MNHPNQFIIFMIAILLQGQIGDYFYVQSNLHMPKLIDSNQIFKFDTTSAISIDFNSNLFINTRFFRFFADSTVGKFTLTSEKCV